jgi:hypothetical protein
MRPWQLQARWVSFLWHLVFSFYHALRCDAAI